jgi:hypothetical protein
MDKIYKGMDKLYNNSNMIWTTLNHKYYRLFDNNLSYDRVIINGKIDLEVKNSKYLNNILNIDNNCNNIANIPMVNYIYLEYLNNKQLINVEEWDIFDNNHLSNDNIQFLSVKNNDNIMFRDILIHTSNCLIIIELYKLKKPIDDITHGVLIIYQHDYNIYNPTDTIYYTKNNNKLILDSIYNTNKLVDKIMNYS